MPTKLAKQSGPTKFFAGFPHNPKLCPVHALQSYEATTKDIRDSNKETIIFSIMIFALNSKGYTDSITLMKVNPAVIHTYNKRMTILVKFEIM